MVDMFSFLLASALLVDSAPPCRAQLADALRRVDAISGIADPIDAVSFTRLEQSMLDAASQAAVRHALRPVVTSAACRRASRAAPASWHRLVALTAQLDRGSGGLAADGAAADPPGERRSCARLQAVAAGRLARPAGLAEVEWSVVQQVDRNVVPQLNAVLGSMNAALCADALAKETERGTTWLQQYAEARAATRADLARVPRVVLGATVSQRDLLGVTVLARLRDVTWRSQPAFVLGLGGAHGMRDGTNRGELAAGVTYRRALVTGGVTLGDERQSVTRAQLDSSTAVDTIARRTVTRVFMRETIVETRPRRVGAVVTAAWLPPRAPAVGVRFSSIDGIGAFLGVGF